MKNSQKVKKILVELAVDDKLPTDMNDLDTSLFSEIDGNEVICGWTRNDVSTVADYMEEDDIVSDVTEDEIDAVFEMIRLQFDASIGMNWETIEGYLQEVVSNRKDKT
jgi:hypothetical protein